MNFINLICNKCECKEKDIIFGMNNKESKNSLINQKIKLPKDEVISNDSTNNLEIIDYPYSFNSKEENLSKLSSNNIIPSPDNHYFIYENSKIQKIPEEKLNNLNSIFNNSNKNSLTSTSLIINNEDSLKQNKALLSNYYANCQKIKKQNIQKKTNPLKNNKQEKKSNLSFKNKKNGSKITLKIETYKQDDIYALLSKINSKSNEQIINNKKKSKKKEFFRPNTNENYIMKKCKTNYKMNITNRLSKSNKNIFLMNEKNNNKEKNLSNKNFIAYKAYNRNYKKNNYETPINRSIKEIMEKTGKLTNYKNFSSSNKTGNKYKNNLKKKLNNSISSNDYILLSKRKFRGYRNTATSNVENQKSHLNFSKLRLNNKGIQSLSNSYINPFDKVKIIKKRNSCKNK